VTLDHRFARSVPWRLPDLYLAVALGVVGLVLLGVSRAGVAGRDELGEQVAWVNVGVLGVIVLAVAGVLWVLAGMRATAELRRSIVHEMRARATPAAPPHLAPAAVPRPRSRPLRATSFVAAPAMTRFHRPDCALVANKPEVSVLADRGHLTPCGVCLPEAAA
jgi:hypothetical protein